MSKRTLNKTCPHCHSRVTVHYRMEEVVVGWGTEFLWPDPASFVCPLCHEKLYPVVPTRKAPSPSGPQTPKPHCTSCRVPTRVVETIEGGGDAVERHVCTGCGKESYVGKFIFRPTLPSTSRAGSKGKHFCTSCNFGTDCDVCPCCSAKLK